MASKPMTLLSMEAVLGKMDLEKLFELRRKSEFVKWVSDGIPVNETRKWDVKYIQIEEDKILADIMKTYVQFTTMNSTKQTRWAAPTVLTIRNSNSEVIRKSIFPVSPTFCKHIESLDISSTQNASEEYFSLVLQLIRRCPKIWTLCVHIPSLTEAQLFQLLDSYELGLREKDRITLSLNASVELTPNFIREFTTRRGIREENRRLLLRQPQNEEVETDKRAAVVQFFMRNGPQNPDRMISRAIIFEEMSRRKALVLVAELETLYEDGYTFYEQGALCFYLGRPGEWIQLEIRQLVM